MKCGLRKISIFIIRKKGSGYTEYVRKKDGNKKQRKIREEELQFNI